MKSRRLPWLASIIFTLSVAAILQAQSVRRLTTTLLPSNEEGALQVGDKLRDGLLWVQREPKKEVTLQFDLSALPLGIIEFKQCTVRLVAKEFDYDKGNWNTGGPLVIVKGRLVGAKDETAAIVSLSTISARQSVAMQASKPLCEAIAAQYSPGGSKNISLKLSTESHKASSVFYSTKSTNTPLSTVPRLVIEYTLEPPSLLEAMSWPQHQQNAEHTGRSPWKPFVNPTGFSTKKIDLPKIDGEAETGEVVDYPLIYQGNTYLVEKVSKRNYLLTLDFMGNKLRQKAIGPGTIQRSPVISRKGIFYIAIEDQANRVVGYDLNRDGEQFAAWNMPGGMSSYTDLTAGNDGSLFLALRAGGNDYVYGLTADLKPFLQSGPLSKGDDRISTVTVSTDGQRIFAQTPKGPLVIDITNPSVEPPHGTYEADTYYHVPIAGPPKPVPTGSDPAGPRAKPAKGVMVSSDFRSSGRANLSGYWADLTKIWSDPGTLIPQPVLGSNGFVYFIRDDKLQAHPYNKKGAAVVTGGDKLNATSNLVMDGADNIYFWDSGVLRGYKASEQPNRAAQFAQIDFADLKRTTGKNTNEPEQFIRLMVGPDGTLWANNRNASSLYAFKPAYADANLSLNPADFAPGENLEIPRVYRTTGTLTVGDSATLKAKTNTLFQAQGGIVFGNGFTVEKGASLLCRTGF